MSPRVIHERWCGLVHLHVNATVDDYDRWKADFESYHDLRAEHGGRSYQLFQSSADPNAVVVLIEFDDEDGARDWVAYLDGERELDDPNMTDVEISYLEMVEQQQLPVA